MDLAHQITNQPLLSSPPHLPRTTASSSNARPARLHLLSAKLSPPPFLDQGCLRLQSARAASAFVARASSSAAKAEPKSEGGEGRRSSRSRERGAAVRGVRGGDRQAVRAQVRQGPRRRHLHRCHLPRRLRRQDRQVHRRRQGARHQTDRSAVFEEEIWPAAGYGQTMYCIRQRVGPLYMKMEKRFGKWDGAAELTEKEIIRAEKNSGVVSNRVREIQLQNYQRKMEQKMQREEDLRMGLRLYNDGKYEEALEKFESVLGSKPESNEASIASYNVACCYSKLGRKKTRERRERERRTVAKLCQFVAEERLSEHRIRSIILQIQAGLSALEDAMKAGYEDFKRIRTNPDLANLRKSEEFDTLLKKYDESFINENAINAIKSLFGFNKK